MHGKYKDQLKYFAMATLLASSMAAGEYFFFNGSISLTGIIAIVLGINLSGLVLKVIRNPGDYNPE